MLHQLFGNVDNADNQSGDCRRATDNREGCSPSLRHLPCFLSGRIVGLDIDDVVLAKVKVWRQQDIAVVKVQAVHFACNVGFGAVKQDVLAFALDVQVSGEGDGLKQVKALIIR